MRALFITLAILMAVTVFGAGGGANGTLANGSTLQEDEQQQKLKDEIGLDYSMPDYRCTKIDERKMGEHLARMLVTLQKESGVGTYSQCNSFLSKIQKEELGVDYVSVKKVTLKEVSKQGNTITIKYRTLLQPNASKKTESEITMTFVDGVSASKVVNRLFLQLSRFVDKSDLSLRL